MLFIAVNSASLMAREEIGFPREQVLEWGDE